MERNNTIEGKPSRHIVFLQWLAGSFMAVRDGASARKLTAFACVMLAAYVHRYATKETATTFLVIDLAAALVALGVITIEQIIRLKNGSEKANN